MAADSERIEQVMTNLLANAVKHSPADAPIAVVLQRDTTHVRVSVHDHGPGIPANEQDKIWERFYRIPGARAVSGVSSGFGWAFSFASRSSRIMVVTLA